MILYVKHRDVEIFARDNAWRVYDLIALLMYCERFGKVPAHNVVIYCKILQYKLRFKIIFHALLHKVP